MMTLLALVKVLFVRDSWMGSRLQEFWATGILIKATEEGGAILEIMANLSTVPGFYLYQGLFVPS